MKRNKRLSLALGVKMFFYDSDSVKREFGKYELVEFSEINETNKNKENKPPLKFIIVKCKKEPLYTSFKN